MKKKFAFLLACLMMVSAAGCSTQEAASSSSSDASSSSTGSSASETAESSEETPAEPDKLTYWVELNANASQLVQNFGDTELAKEWQKRTNTEVEFQHPPVGQVTEAFNILCASGDYPDIIEYPWINYAGGPQAAISNGIIIPLNDVFEQYGPNITAVLEGDPDLEKMVKTDDGNFYVFPCFRSDSAEYVQASEGFVIRKDYLDQLGLEVPETIDEWYTVLTAFKNELNVEIPFCLRGAEHFDRVFQGAFDSYDDFYVEDGVVKHGLLEPGRREFLTEMHKWYEEGLLDNDYLVVDKKTQASYVTTGRCAATYAPGSGGIGTWLPAMQEVDPSVELVSAPPVTSVKGQNAKFSRVNPVYSGSTSCPAITTSCENIEAAARLLDYGYSEEGHMLMNFGIEGVSYEMVDGYPKYTDLIMNNPDGIAFSQIVSLYSRSSTGPVVGDERVTEQSYSLPELQDALKLWARTDMGKYLLPPLSPTAEEASELAQIVNNVNTYKQEMEAKFASGAESLDNFDAFVEQLKNLGLERAIEIQQKAYDNYLKR